LFTGQWGALEEMRPVIECSLQENRQEVWIAVTKVNLGEA